MLRRRRGLETQMRVPSRRIYDFPSAGESLCVSQPAIIRAFVRQNSAARKPIFHSDKGTQEPEKTTLYLLRRNGKYTKTISGPRKWLKTRLQWYVSRWNAGRNTNNISSEERDEPSFCCRCIFFFNKKWRLPWKNNTLLRQYLPTRSDGFRLGKKIVFDVNEGSYEFDLSRGLGRIEVNFFLLRRYCRTMHVFIYFFA